MGGSEYNCWLKGAKVLSTFSPMTNKMLSTPPLNTAMAGKHLSVFRLSLMCLLHGGRPPMVMGMFMGCGPRDSKSYPFESQFKRVVLHRSTRRACMIRVGHKKWPTHRCHYLLKLRQWKSRFEKMEKEEKENLHKEVTDREHSDGRFALHGVLK